MTIKEFRQKLKPFLLEGWTSYVLIAAAFGVALVLIAVIARYYVNDVGHRLTKDFTVIGKPVECKIVADPDRRAFINEQRTEIARYANGHRETAIEFAGFFYATLVIFSIFGLIAAISLAIITKTGIGSASPHLVAVLLISSGIVILYQGFFGIFQQKANIENNAKLSINYAKLVNQIDTYCTTGKVNVRDPNQSFIDAMPKSPGKSAVNANIAANGMKLEEPAAPAVKITQFYLALEPDEFINYVDWQMELYKAFAIAIDDSKISSIDAKKMLPL